MNGKDGREKKKEQVEEVQGSVEERRVQMRDQKYEQPFSEQRSQTQTAD